jgi:hypothetical protein
MNVVNTAPVLWNIFFVIKIAVLPDKGFITLDYFHHSLIFAGKSKPYLSRPISKHCPQMLVFCGGGCY